MNKGIDKNTDCTAQVGCIKSAGYSFICSYINRTHKPEIDHISSMGLYNVSIYETNPTSYGYFSAAQGVHDATAALAYAKALGQPEKTPIYFTVDFDASPAEASGEIAAYFGAIRETINKGGEGPYTVGVYGNGSVLKVLTSLDLVEYRWLSMSSGWSGSAGDIQWELHQVGGGSLCGLSVDFDVSNGAAGGWKSV